MRKSVDVRPVTEIGISALHYIKTERLDKPKANIVHFFRAKSPSSPKHCCRRSVLSFEMLRNTALDEALLVHIEKVRILNVEYRLLKVDHFATTGIVLERLEILRFIFCR